MFKTMITPEVSPSSIEGKTIKRFIKYWTNFAKTSDPNQPKVDGIMEGIVWPKTDGNVLLHFGEELKITEMPEIERMAFWDKIDTITNNKL